MFLPSVELDAVAIQKRFVEQIKAECDRRGIPDELSRMFIACEGAIDGGWPQFTHTGRPKEWKPADMPWPWEFSHRAGMSSGKSSMTTELIRRALSRGLQVRNPLTGIVIPPPP
jgi:hypothetical protein